METKYPNFVCSNNCRLGVVAGLAFCLLSPRPVHGASELDDELRYIDALQQLQMPDIAAEVIEDVRKQYPDAGPQLKVREIQGLLRQGKFAEVQKVVDAMADKNGAEYWALFLALADAYYAFSNYPEADKRYIEFFKKVDKPPAALAAFYRDSAYKYAQMLLLLNRDTDALAAYRYLFKIPLDEVVLRQVQAEVAELLIKIAPADTSKESRDAKLKEAEGLVDRLLWKQDIWFGKAIVMKAHIILQRGNLKGARDMVENYMPQLKTIHDALLKDDPDGSQGQLRMSPMPQCRYLLGVLLLNEAQAEIKKGDAADNDRIKDLLLGERDPNGKARKGDGAFNHFINVFIRFPESQWAADAGERAEAVRKLVKERYAADIQTPVTEEQMRKVRQLQFANAKRLFSENQFEQATERFLQVLNQFPEYEESVPALGDLAIAYIELSDKNPDAGMMAEVVTGHLSERFAAKPKLVRSAGDQVRRIGDFYGERKMEDKKRETYAMFFRDYPEHHAASQLVMQFGEREFAAGNFKGAEMYYKQIAESYPSSPYYYDALSRLAQCQKEMGNALGEVEALEVYVAKLGEKGKPSHAQVVGKFRLANAQRDYAMSLLKGAATNAVPDAAAPDAAAPDAAAPDAGAAPDAAAPDAGAALAKARAGAAEWLAKAVTGLNEVSKLLGASQNDYQTNPEETQRNEQMKELAVFMRAVCMTQMQHPADKVPAFRKAAIEAFEEYIKAYPKGQHAPKALLQIGTLYTILQDVNGAQAALERLNKEFPTSDEAKNSVPLLASALIEMDLRAEGVAMYRKMFAAKGTYTDGQFMAAGKALEEAKEFDLALQAYDNVMSLTKDALMTAQAKLGRARSLAAKKSYTSYADARKLLAEFIKDYAKLSLVVDANLLLAEVASEEGALEKNDAERTDLFNMAVNALRVVRRYRTEVDQQKEIDLMSGQVMVRKMTAEKKSGLDAKAAESRGKAIVTFNNIIDSTDTGNPKLAAVVEKAYFYTLPLMLEHKQVNDQVVESCENYLRVFPAGRYRAEVQNWLNQAKIGN